MPIPVSEYVQININLATPSGPKFGFGSLLGVFDHTVNLARKNGPYSSISAVVAAGFTSTAAPAVHGWATVVFSQPRGVDSVLIGRSIPSTGGPASKVWQVDVSGPVFIDETADFNGVLAADWQPFPSVEAIGDYAAFGSLEPFSKVTLNNAGGTAGTVGTVAWEYWDGSAWTALAGVVDGSSGFTAAVSDGQVVSWTIPVDWATTSLNAETALYYIRARVTATYTVNPVYDDGTVGGDASWTVTMDAIQEAPGASWYNSNIESRAATPIQAVSAWTEAQNPRKIFVAQTSQAAILTATAGNLAEVLSGLTRRRTVLDWHALDAEWADGGVSSVGGGLNLDTPAGVGIWGFQPIASVTTNALNEVQFGNIFTQDANVIGTSGGRVFFTKGRTCSGEPIDIITTSDWIEARLQETLLDLWVQTPTKIPYTDAGIAAIVGACQAIFDNGVSFGHFSGSPAPLVVGPAVADVSDQDKQDRKLTLTATATLAGAIESVIPFTINLSF